MPGTWPEAAAAKQNRQLRDRRHYTPDLLGPPCVGGCGTRTVAALANQGILAHPACGPNADGVTIGA